jgi:hypothetical protein
MTNAEAPLAVPLERAIKNAILQRTGGRIRMLEVSVAGNVVVVRGRSPSYHVEQLALRGVFDVVGTSGATRVELRVRVSATDS